MMSAALARASPFIVAHRPRGPRTHTSRASKTTTPPTRAMAASPSSETTVVSAEWLRDNITRPDVKVLDCSWYLPAMERDPIAEHEAKRVPGARYFDVDRVSDRASHLPHMLPSAGAFAAACDAVGVTNGDQVVVYDGAGLFSAARGWWMFKVFGHDAVALLDGGMGAWESLESAELETSPPLYPASASADACARHTPGDALTFDAVLKPELVLSKADVLARCVGADADEILVDARPKPRWAGEAPEPRAGIRSGRVPGSACVPFFDILNGTARTFKSRSEIEGMFKEAGADLGAMDDGDGKKIVASCGTGVTACVLSLGAAMVRKDGTPLPVYDGSWTEWGAEDSGCPVDGK